MFELAFIPIQLLPVILIIYFVALWCVVNLLLAYVSGWQKLAKKYKATQKPGGKAFRAQSGTIGVVPCSNSLHIQTNQEGLFVSITFLLRNGKPDLFIPWSEIRIVNRERGVRGNSSSITIAIGNPPIGKMTLPSKIFDDREIIA